MAITTYATLSSAVQSFSLDRTDLATPMPDLVAMAEQAIYFGLEGMEPLRVLDMETKTSLTPTAGVCTLPTNYLQWRRVVETSSPRRELDYIAPAGMDQQYATRSAGLGNFFTVIGMTIETAPLVSNTVELTYYASPVALDSAAPTEGNSMLVKYPSVYLRATMAMGYEYLKNGEEMQKQLALLKSLIGACNRQTQMSSLAKTGISFRRQVR
jgi:hypothetical protein